MDGVALQNQTYPGLWEQGGDGRSSELCGIETWRLLSAEGAWRVPGFCLAPVLPPGLGRLRNFLPFPDQCWT